MVEQIFLSPQLKRNVIVSNKLVYTRLNNDLPKDLKFRKYHKNLKTSFNYCLALSPTPEMKIPSALANISRKTEIKPFPQRTISHEN